VDASTAHWLDAFEMFTEMSAEFLSNKRKNESIKVALRGAKPYVHDNYLNFRSAWRTVRPRLLSIGLSDNIEIDGKPENINGKLWVPPTGMRVFHGDEAGFVAFHGEDAIHAYACLEFYINSVTQVNPLQFVKDSLLAQGVNEHNFDEMAPEGGWIIDNPWKRS
jgi:hypothetical protein